MLWKYKNKNKYNAKKTNGFDSKLEFSVFKILKALEKSGEIKDIKCQHRIELVAGINWKVDFSYYDNENNQTVWVEAKGIETEGYRIKKKLWKVFGPGKLEIWKGNYGNPKLVEIVNPKH